VSNTKRKYIFGPVPSRRLGSSLGVDLVPYKTCTLDCIYCQIGKTTEKTSRRFEYVPTKEVVRELKEVIDEGTKPDVITMSGSGEPTLHLGIGEIIRTAKDICDIPVVVLTNATTLHLPEVREALMPADIVAPSLDAGTKDMFEIINRPASGVSFEGLVEGLTLFAKDYKGKLLVEVLVLAGMNSTESEMIAIRDILSGIELDEVQLNTVTRPPAEEFAESVKREKLEELALLFDPPATVIADFKGKSLSSRPVGEDEILDSVSRRPMTADDISQVTGMDRRVVGKVISELVSRQKLVTSNQSGRIYYSVPR